MSNPICAHQVKFLGKNGTDQDLKEAMKRLKIGKIYSVYRIDIDSFETRISLKGYPNDFNSVMFEAVNCIY